MKLILLALASLTLLSCAAIQENFRKNCAAKNWEQIGREDALAGKKRTSSELGRCMEEVQTPPNRTEYDKGYAEGLAQFCTQEYGLYFGREGNSYSDTCPSKIANGFLAGYSQGKIEYERLQASKQQARALEDLSDSRKLPGIKCSFNSDCKIQSKCESSSSSVRARMCVGTNDPCSFDSDCNLQGRCEHQTCKWN